MPVLVFSGDFVASQFSLDEQNKNKTDAEIDETPFLATDIVRITIDDRDVEPNGEFDDSLVRFTSFTVERDGTVYSFGVDSGSKIKESGGGSAKEQGDTYFVMNDAAAPPSSGPFSGLEEQEYLFSTDTSFADGPDTYRLDRRSNQVEGEKDGNFNIQSATVACFSAGTRVLTESGYRAVQTLASGDRLYTVDNGLQPIRLVVASRHSWPRTPHRSKPVLIRRGALGAGLPMRDLMVSPQHRMLMPDPSGYGTYFSAARHLAALASVRQMHGAREATYYHIVLEQHAVIFAEGAPTESFFPGEFAMRSLHHRDRRAVRAIMKDGAQTAPARRFTTGKIARQHLAAPNCLWSEARLAQLDPPLLMACASA